VASIDEFGELGLGENGEGHAEGGDGGIEIAYGAGFDVLVEIAGNGGEQRGEMLTADFFGFSVNLEQSYGDEADEFGREGGGVNEDIEDARNEDFGRGFAAVWLEGAETGLKRLKTKRERRPEDVFLVFEVAKESDFTDVGEASDVSRTGAVVSLAREECNGCTGDPRRDICFSWHIRSGLGGTRMVRRKRMRGGAWERLPRG